MPNPLIRLAAMICFPVLASTAVPALATPISGTINGTILSGTDDANFFGGGNLAGDAISVSYSFDVSGLPNHGTGGISEQYNSTIGSTVGAIHISATIGATTISVGSTSNDFSSVQDQVGNTTHTQYNFQISPFAQSPYSVALTLMTEGAWQLGTLGNAPLGTISGYSLTDGGYTQTLSIQGHSGADYNIQFYVPISTQTNAPEPASLAILGLGAAALGIARRRR